MSIKRSSAVKALFLLAVCAMMLALITGCGKTAPTSGTSSTDQAAGPTVLKVGATPKPHAEILEFIKPILAEQGIDLQVVPFTDYNTPNLALDSGDIDANFFQHQPYLDAFNADHNLKLVTIAKVHIEPMGVYSHKVKSLDQLQAGSTVVIPNDVTNAGRALAVLESAGVIKLKEGAGIKATLQDVAENPRNLKITLLDAAQLPRVIDDPKVAAAVINTNFALEGGLDPLKDPLFLEAKDSPYANILVVKDTRTSDPALKKLAGVLNSPQVKQFIEEQYKGAVIPAF